MGGLNRSKTRVSSEDNQDHQASKKQVANASFARIMSYYSPKVLMVVTFFTAFGVAAAFPLIGWFSARMQFVLYNYQYVDEDTYNENRAAAIWQWVLLTFVISCLIGIERISIGVAGENLTLAVRKLLLRSIIYKQLCWFDNESRAPGVLLTNFAEDITLLNGMTTESVILIIEPIMTMVVGVIIGCYFSWEITLICVGLSPLVFAGVVAMSRLQFGIKAGKQDGQDKEADPYEKANALLSEVVLNYKTIQSFGNDNIESIFEKFGGYLSIPLEQNIGNAHKAGVSYGYSQCVRIIFISISYYLGTIILQYTDKKPEAVFTAINILNMAATSAGLSVGNLPSMARAKASAQKIFRIIDEASSLDVREAHKAEI